MSMIDTYPKPKGVSEELWEGVLWHYPDIVKRIYNIATSSDFIYGNQTNYGGKTKYDAINEQIKTIVVFPHYREYLTMWRDQLLSTTQADPTPKLTPNNITRQIVICKI
jgi:hypothetical protein